jgi:hypothetical protein
MCKQQIGQFACSLARSWSTCPIITPPDIKPSGTLTLHEMSSIILDKIEEVDVNNSAEIYLPDNDMKFYRKKDVKNYLGITEVDKIPFIDEAHDCDDFAAELFGLFAGLIWTTAHAFNWFVDENGQLWFIEPQNDKMSLTIEGWQGNDIGLFIGR